MWISNWIEFAGYSDTAEREGIVKFAGWLNFSAQNRNFTGNFELQAAVVFIPSHFDEQIGNPITLRSFERNPLHGGGLRTKRDRGRFDHASRSANR